jgi:hypothetical protein
VPPFSRETLTRRDQRFFGRHHARRRRALAQTVTGPTAADVPREARAPSGLEHALTGTGIRTKTFLKVKVYAFGLYVDPAGATTALAGFAGKDATALEKDKTFYETLLQMQFPMTLRLVMTRDVGGEDMAEAFDGALRPRVIRAAAEKNMPGGEAALETFRGFFSVGEMTKDSELLFTPPGRTLSSSVKGPIPARVARTLLGAVRRVQRRQAHLQHGKKSVVASFPDLLARQ